jgi:GTP-binding protein
LTRAFPKIAHYPFTTLRPYVGTVKFVDGSKMTLSDLPGIIEGAHENKGLGHDFL